MYHTNVYVHVFHYAHISVGNRLEKNNWLILIIGCLSPTRLSITIGMCCLYTASTINKNSYNTKIFSVNFFYKQHIPIVIANYHYFRHNLYIAFVISWLDKKKCVFPIAWSSKLGSVLGRDIFFFLWNLQVCSFL